MEKLPRSLRRAMPCAFDFALSGLKPALKGRNMLAMGIAHCMVNSSVEFLI